MLSNNEKLTKREQWDDIYSNRTLPLLPDTRSWLGRQIFPFINKFCESIDQLSFLEAGCAPGRYGIYFAKTFNASVHGFDYSPEGVELTRKNWRNVEIDGEVHEADVFSLPTSFRNSFDVVLSAGLIEHFNNPAELTRIFHSILKKDGLIITIIPHTCRCLNTDLMRLFNGRGYKKMKETHLPINYRMFSEYHDMFDILYEKRIIGFFPAQIFTKNNLISKISRRLLDKFLIAPSLLAARLQYDYLATHFLIIGKKI